MTDELNMSGHCAKFDESGGAKAQSQGHRNGMAKAMPSRLYYSIPQCLADQILTAIAAIWRLSVAWV